MQTKRTDKNKKNQGIAKAVRHCSEVESESGHKKVVDVVESSSGDGCGAEWICEKGAAT